MNTSSLTVDIGVKQFLAAVMPNMAIFVRKKFNDSNRTLAFLPSFGATKIGALLIGMLVNSQLAYLL